MDEMMTVLSTVMIDTIHADVNHVPSGVADIGGYVSGSVDIDWTSGDWARFPNSKHVRIWQGFGAVPAINGFDVIDVETGAVTPQQAADKVAERVANGITWTTIYGSDSFLATTSSLIQAKGHAVWNGHVNAWLADWNLNEVGAEDKLGSYIHGMTCIGVQWASPTSNPNTILPGSSLTLAQSNCDLSRVNKYWIPSGGWDAPVTPPVVTTVNGVLVRIPEGTTSVVHSTDGGATWK